MIKDKRGFYVKYQVFFGVFGCCRDAMNRVSTGAFGCRDAMNPVPTGDGINHQMPLHQKSFFVKILMPSPKGAASQNRSALAATAIPNAVPKNCSKTAPV